MHHVYIYSSDEIDKETRDWIFRRAREELARMRGKRKARRKRANRKAPPKHVDIIAGDTDEEYVSMLRDLRL